MKELQLKWSPNGSWLAVSGKQFVSNATGESKEISVLQVYTPIGTHLKSLKIPGKQIHQVSWEWTNLRLGLAVDSFIYFATIRPEYQWTWFAKDVLAMALQRKEGIGKTLYFWNTKTMEWNCKNVLRVHALTSFEEHCVLVYSQEDGKTVVSIHNAIGVSVDSKSLDFIPTMACMNQGGIVLASSEFILYWPWKSKVNPLQTLATLNSLLQKDSQDVKGFHIDDMTVIGNCCSDTLVDFKVSRPSKDAIVGMCLGIQSGLYVSKESGSLLEFSLPSLTLENKYSTDVGCRHLRLNSNGTLLSLIQPQGILKIFQISHSKYHSFEKKDVWDIVWSAEEPHVFGYMEKNKWVQVYDFESQEPIQTQSYLVQTSSSQTRLVDLDALALERNPKKEFLILHESHYLNQLLECWTSHGPKKAMIFADKHPSAQLYPFLAEKALKSLDLQTAQIAFGKASDYYGLQFVKKLVKLQDVAKQKAEIALFYTQIDEAEKLYLEMDRKDLALDLRAKLGDWNRFLFLSQSGTDDSKLKKAWNALGDYYFERQLWKSAVEYYSLSQNMSKWVQALYILDEFEALEKVIPFLNETQEAPLLEEIASKFLSVGLVEPAVDVYLKLNQVEKAIDACVGLNQWNLAIQLAKQHASKQVESLLNKFGSLLQGQGKQFEAIELYRKANDFFSCAQLFFQLAMDQIPLNSDPILVKQLFVLGAIELEKHYKLTQVHVLKKTKLQSLMQHPWRGALAFHFYISAQKHYYAGNMDSALYFALYLRNFDDILPSQVIFSLLALVAFHSQHFGICSKAFIKLESMEGQGGDFEDLAVSIFTKYPPRDPDSLGSSFCSHCMNSISPFDSHCSFCHFEFPICIASGKFIHDSIFFTCSTCHSKAIENEIRSLSCCPLVCWFLIKKDSWNVSVMYEFKTSKCQKKF